MELKKMLFVVNPNAGKGEIRSKALEVIDCFVRNGWTVTVHTTQRAGELPHLLAERAGGFDRVVCCGGDGTLNETVSGLIRLENRPSLGYLPAGTVNDFASSLGLSRDLLVAAEVAGGGQPFQFDVGRFNDRYFTYVAAFGLFTQVAYETPQQSKNILGRTAYVLEGLRRLPQIKAYHMSLETENSRISGNFIFGMFSNAKSVGGVALSPKAQISMSDGLLECVLVRQPQSMQEVQRSINAVLAQNYDSDAVVAFRAAWLRISSSDQAPWTLDGEYGGADETITIENLHEALTVSVDFPPEAGATEAMLPETEPPIFPAEQERKTEC